jgi:hypothetical protein
MVVVSAAVVVVVVVMVVVVVVVVLGPTSTCGTPLGAGGIGARENPPRRVLSRVN